MSEIQLPNGWEEAVNSQAYGKLAIFGDPGSGKTRTATNIMIGICQRLGVKGPVLFFDTEGSGSDFALKTFRAAGIQVIRKKSRSFTAALGAYEVARQVKAVGIIFDSATHLWKDVYEGAMKAKGRTRLTMPEWGKCKMEWAPFSDGFVNSPIHVIVCGRAGKIYEEGVDEKGQKTLTTIGTKMKAEGEFGYEASLVIEMHKEFDEDENGTTRLINRAVVLKDRADEINGKVFDFPSFKSFEPHFNYLNIGGNHTGVDLKSDSSTLFSDDDDGRGQAIKAKQKQILIEEIYALIESEWPGQQADAKAKRNEEFVGMSEYVGNAAPRSKTAFESMGLTAIQKAHQHICIRINEDRLANGVAKEHLLAVPDYANQDTTLESAG
jgi:hypothetical protein